MMIQDPTYLRANRPAKIVDEIHGGLGPSDGSERVGLAGARQVESREHEGFRASSPANRSSIPRGCSGVVVNVLSTRNAQV